MKITNAEVLAAQKAVGEFVQSHTKTPIALALEIRYMAKELDAHAKTIAEVHLELLKTHGTEEDEEWSVDPKGPTFKAFAKDYTELLERECEVQHTLKLSDFTVSGPDGKRVKMDIDASFVFGLGSLLVDDANPNI
jgi:hypothetical protein